MDTSELKIPTVAELQAQGIKPDYIFWVGCAGSFDDRAKKITKAFAKILQASKVSFAVLGQEESCSGDPAKRAGNEFLFQMQAMANIEVLNAYETQNIVTACPHCFNTLKNEYPGLGGHYNVIHHTQLLAELFEANKLLVSGGHFKGKKITYHDPCYLGRANNIYEIPREVLSKLDAELVEMKKCKKNGLCCGAGGAQMFKESEKGHKEINVERAEQVKATNADILASSCPFCNIMMNDGLSFQDESNTTEVKDIAELIAEAADL